MRLSPRDLRAAQKQKTGGAIGGLPKGHPVVFKARPREADQRAAYWSMATELQPGMVAGCSVQV